MTAKTLPWKPEYGIKFGATESDQGGNFSVFLPILQKENRLRDKMSVFSIGGGYGALEVHIAKEYQAKLGFLDPSPNLIDSFKKRVDKAGVSPQVIEIHETPFQEAISTEKYDLVLAIHSWYYIGCDRIQIHKARTLVKPGGALYIALSSRQCMFQEILEKIQPADEGSFELEDLAGFLTAQKIHSERKDYTADIPLSRYVVGNSFTEFGKQWVAYMSRLDWDAIPTETKKKVLTWMNHRAEDGILKRRWGALVLGPA